MSSSDGLSRDGSGGYADDYIFSGNSGDLVTIDLTSSSFDAYLYLFNASGEMIASNDDGGSGLNSQIMLILPATGAYTIEAKSVSAGSIGSYSISLSVSIPTPPTPISYGQSFSGDLSSGDGLSRSGSGSYADNYSFSGNSGDQITIDLTSVDFDAYLYLYDPSGQQIAYNDDGGSGLNSQIMLILPATGTYTIEATSVSSGATGSYDISLAGSIPSPPTPISYGQSIPGNLSSSDGQSRRRSGAYADFYAFHASSGDQVTIDLTTSSFDAYLYLYDSNGNLITYDDDSGGGGNSRIIYAISSAGEYVIEATSYGSGATGSYDIFLSVSISSPPTPISYGQSISGNLSSGDNLSRGRSGSFADFYSFSGNSGDQVSIDLTTSSFDAYLYFYDPSGQEIAYNDDGGSSHDSKIILTLPATGTYTIEATSYESGATGSYNISLSGSISTPPTPISYGQSISGNLSSSDGLSRRRSGTYADFYVFHGDPGETITIDLASSNFDAYLYLYDSNGNVVTYDDDSGGSNIARITYRIPSSGDYTIEATSYSSGSTGSYSISLGKSGSLQLAYSQLDASNFPVIESYLTVRDATGNYVSGLSSSNFSVSENNTAQSPIDVTVIGTSGSALTTVMVLDRSGSMGDYSKLADLKAASQTFIDNLRSSDKCEVLSFSDSPVVDQSFTNDKNLLKTAIDNLYADGGTALFDATYMALSELALQTGRRAVIVFGDGDDNSSYTHTLDDVISYANSIGVSIFTVGLGLTDDSKYLNLALLTSGAFYSAPTSSELDQIYQNLSESFASQYRIIYTTSNQSADGTTRTVQISVSYSGNNASASKTYTAPSTPTGSIFATSTASSYPQGSFWIDINVAGVTDLFGTSFILNYDQTSYISVVPPESSNVVAGSFLGTDLVFYPDASTAGQVSIGVSAKSGASGKNGNGTVARVQFQANSSTPESTVVTFTLTNIRANNSSGGAISLSQTSYRVTITNSIQNQAVVWPGDANNNGYVDQADILPIGLYWHSSGTVRPNRSSTWTGQSCTPWSPPAATYADCDGSGYVDQADILPIGLNWHKSHTLLAVSGELAAETGILNGGELKVEMVPCMDAGEFRQAGLYQMNLGVDPALAGKIRGISFSLEAAGGAEILAIRKGKIWSQSALFFVKSEENRWGVAVTELPTSDLQPFWGDFTLASVIFRPAGMTGGSADFRLLVKDVRLSLKSGQIVTLDSPTDNMFSSSPDAGLPKAFSLGQNSPNPFNPATTISYSVPENGLPLNLEIYDLRGRLVVTLVDGISMLGSFRVTWDGKDRRGNLLPSGVYIYMLKMGSQTAIKKMVLLK